MELMKSLSKNGTAIILLHLEIKANKKYGTLGAHLGTKRKWHPTPNKLEYSFKSLSLQMEMRSMSDREINESKDRSLLPTYPR